MSRMDTQTALSLHPHSLAKKTGLFSVTQHLGEGLRARREIIAINPWEAGLA